MTATQQSVVRRSGVSLTTAPYIMRIVLGGVGLLYYHQAGAVSGFLPCSLIATLALIAAYVAANGALLAVYRSLSSFQLYSVLVTLDLVMLTLIVLQDPYPASPVTILLLSTVLDYGRLPNRQVFSGVTLLILLILAINAYARWSSGQTGFPPEGIWLSLAIGVLIVNYYLAALSAAEARTERRRLAAEVSALREREHRAIAAQLRAAQIGQQLRFNGLPWNQFAQQGLSCLAREFGFSAAALYRHVEDQAGAWLVPAAGYAVDPQQLPQRRMPLDQGLLGTCARERRMIELHPVPAGYFKIVSALGQASPSHLYLLPLHTQTRLAAVMELASLQPLPADEMKLLEQLTETFAAALGVAATQPEDAAPSQPSSS